jgi:hypothetical protein
MHDMQPPLQDLAVGLERLERVEDSVLCETSQIRSPNRSDISGFTCSGYPHLSRKIDHDVVYLEASTGRCIYVQILDLSFSLRYSYICRVWR